jgi:urocanate reductase
LEFCERLYKKKEFRKMSKRGYRETSDVEKLNCDNTVIGGGGSGLAAAVAAAEKGAKVVLLEK